MAATDALERFCGAVKLAEIELEDAAIQASQGDLGRAKGCIHHAMSRINKACAHLEALTGETASWPKE